MALFIKPTALLIITLSGIIQALIEFNVVHYWCVLLATVSSVATTAYVLDINRFRAHPMSMIVVLGYNVSALSGALLVQTATLRSLTYNLQVPLATFSALTAVQFLVLGLHWGYVRSGVLQAIRRRLTYRSLAPLGFFDPPSNGQLWFMGFVGCAALWTTDVSLRDQVEFGDVTLKFIQGLAPFTIAPFLIPLARYVFADGARRVQWSAIGAYFVFLVFIGIARNSRTTFASGMLTIGLIYLTCVLSERIILSPKKLVWALVILLGSVPILSALSNIATAMVIARDQRSVSTPLELVSLTIDAYLDSNALKYRRWEESIVTVGLYNEVYVSNPMLARFVYTKFVDLNIAEVLALGSSDIDKARELFLKRVLAILPTPVLNVVAPNLDKKDLAFSSGDFYSAVMYGVPLGGYRTGSSIADGLAITNVFYFLLLAVIVLINFIFFDSLTKFKGGWPIYSGVALLNIWVVFTNGVVSESVAQQVGSVVRGFPEMLVVYGLMFQVSRLALVFRRRVYSS
jgi:hypothetical protein